jgi:D-alanine--poly(phosphoribitol) ligase subunit 1
MHVLDRIDAVCRRVPDRVAHRSEGRTLGYAELRRRSDALAASIARLLPDDRSPIVVVGHKEPEILVGLLGAAKAGHAYVPLDSGLPRARIERTVAVAAAGLVLTPERVRELAEGDVPAPPRGLGGDDPFYVIFTSGSTGDPKGVVITGACLESFIDWMLDEQRFSENREVFLNQAPFSFDLSVMDLYLCLSTGGTLTSVTADEIANPKRLYRTLAASGVTVWVSTPSFARMCLAERSFGEAMLPALRRFLFCGETLPPEVAAALLDRFPRAEVWNTYGPTEATVATTSVRIDRALLARGSPLPVGRTKPGTRILVVGDDGAPAPAGARGEIVIAGPNVSVGYLGRPDLTAQAFFHLDGARAYRTGDQGRFDDGLLFFEGRTDDQVKLHGYRIELGDVEANFRAIARVRDAVVLPVLKAGVPDSLAAFVVLAGTAAAETPAELARSLRAELGGRLPAYMLPRRLEFLDSLPTNLNGKVDRRRLAEMLR